MTTRFYTDERRWASTDPARHFNAPEPRQTDWREQYLELLEAGDEASAHALRPMNDERYAGDREQRAASVFPVRGSELKSLTHAQIERDEAEAA